MWVCPRARHPAGRTHTWRDALRHLLSRVPVRKLGERVVRFARDLLSVASNSLISACGAWRCDGSGDADPGVATQVTNWRRHASQSDDAAAADGAATQLARTEVQAGHGQSAGQRLGHHAERSSRPGGEFLLRWWRSLLLLCRCACCLQCLVTTGTDWSDRVEPPVTSPAAPSAVE